MAVMNSESEYTQPAYPDKLPEPVDKAGGNGDGLTDLIQEVLVLREQVQQKAS